MSLRIIYLRLFKIEIFGNVFVIDNTKIEVLPIVNKINQVDRVGKHFVEIF